VTVVADEELQALMRSSVQDAVRDALFFPLMLSERHDIRLKPNFDTACWSYLPPHRIYVGTGLFKKVKKQLTKKEQQLYVRSHVHHELAHAHFTERDLAKTNAELAREKIPFQLWNLFEDARIEERYRRETEYRFKWLSIEELPKANTPLALFFSLIQSENDFKRVRKWVEKAWNEPTAPPTQVGATEAATDAAQVALEDGISSVSALAQVPTDIKEPLEDVRARLDRVHEYYQRALEAPDSSALYPIMREWLEEFGRTPPQQDSSDLQQGLLLQTDSQALLEFDQDTEPVPDGKPANVLVPNQKGRSKRLVDEQKDLGPVGQEGRVLLKEMAQLDEPQAQLVARRLERFFATAVRTVSTNTPTQRISARAYALNRAPYRRKELAGKVRRRIVLVVDCSGSMGGMHIEEGRTLVRALSILAQKNHVEGHVILSAVNARPNWETWALPMPTDKIACIHGYASAEGLEYALQGNLELVTKADFVFVYTDAQICDRAIDKASLHARAVYTWGLYAGDEAHEPILESLRKFFDKAIMRESALQLVEAMLTQR
jgi:hypothetical protein